MNKSCLLSAVYAGMLFLLSSHCQAAVVRTDVTFSASDFTDVYHTGALPPQGAVSGSFSFLYDDAFPVPDPSDFAPIAVSLVINGFSYAPVNTTVDLGESGGILQGLVFGATLDSIGSNNQVGTGIHDFALGLNLASNTFTNFMYADPSVTNDIFSSVTGEFSMTTTSVPVPAALWLFGSGLLGLIGMPRRRSLAITG